MEARKTMVTFSRLIGAVALVCVGLGTASAQAPQTEAEQIRARQQLVTMETVLTGAISAGAQSVIREVRRVIPNFGPRVGQARVTGVRLDGYGILFNVDVPMIPLPIMFDAMLLEVQTRNALRSIQQLRNEASGMPEGPDRTRLLAQANQLEQDLVLGNFRATQPSRGTVSASSLVPVGVTRSDASDPPSVVNDPEGAYTREVKAALIDSMLNGPALGLRADEWLVIVARDATPPNPQSPADAIDASVQIMRVKGSTLAAFRAGALSIEEARKQVEVKEQ